jgi:hypothetical protein
VPGNLMPACVERVMSVQLAVAGPSRLEKRPNRSGSIVPMVSGQLASDRRNLKPGGTRLPSTTSSMPSGLPFMCVLRGMDVGQLSGD